VFFFLLDNRSVLLFPNLITVLYVLYDTPSGYGHSA